MYDENYINFVKFENQYGNVVLVALKIIIIQQFIESKPTLYII